MSQKLNIFFTLCFFSFTLTNSGTTWAQTYEEDLEEKFQELRHEVSQVVPTPHQKLAFQTLSVLLEATNHGNLTSALNLVFTYINEGNATFMEILEYLHQQALNPKLPVSVRARAFWAMGRIPYLYQGDVTLKSIPYFAYALMNFIEKPTGTNYTKDEKTLKHAATLALAELAFACPEANQRELDFLQPHLWKATLVFRGIKNQASESQKYPIDLELAGYLGGLFALTSRSGGMNMRHSISTVDPLPTVLRNFHNFKNALGLLARLQVFTGRNPRTIFYQHLFSAGSYAQFIPLYEAIKGKYKNFQSQEALNMDGLRSHLGPLHFEMEMLKWPTKEEALPYVIVEEEWRKERTEEARTYQDHFPEGTFARRQQIHRPGILNSIKRFFHR